ncbi:MAG: NADH-quinone oxidoreductase subunit N, partial [Boseongicola sp.]|nr:NADH-quinone oxidoreductase subunit N [Boseongicola sp.]
MQPGDLSIILPEIILSVYALAALLFGAYAGKDKTAPLLVGVTSALLASVAAWIACQGGGRCVAFGGMLID